MIFIFLVFFVAVRRVVDDTPRPRSPVAWPRPCLWSVHLNSCTFRLQRGFRVRLVHTYSCTAVHLTYTQLKCNMHRNDQCNLAYCKLVSFGIGYCSSLCVRVVSKRCAPSTKEPCTALKSEIETLIRASPIPSRKWQSRVVPHWGSGGDPMGHVK